MHPGPEVVHPDLGRVGYVVGPRGLLLEEQDVRLDTTGVEDARGQAQERVEVELLEEAPPDLLASPALEQDVVGQDDRCATVHLQQQHDVLQEVQLLVGRRRPEVGPVVGDVFPVGLAVRSDDCDGRLLSPATDPPHRITGERAYYRCFSPTPVPLASLVRVAGSRWRVEETFQSGKGPHLMAKRSVPTTARFINMRSDNPSSEARTCHPYFLLYALAPPRVQRAHFVSPSAFPHTAHHGHMKTRARDQHGAASMSVATCRSR